MEIVNLYGNDLGGLGVKSFQLCPDFVGRSIQQDYQHTNSKTQFVKQDSAEETGRSATSVLDLSPSPVDESNVCAISPICPAPICRQFWKAGTYYSEGLPAKSAYQSSGHLHIHPKFLHSNATSHKWAFGAIAELLDNAVDEIQNGATYVIIDKTSNPRDGSPALLIQDDGSGMDPEAIRRCMSFGFSDKESSSSIGHYGNGFKTSTMRLGGDVIVFSRKMTNKKWTQSIGLLSYTFLTQEGLDRIVVPMVDYEFNPSTDTFEALQKTFTNLSVLLQWSPFSTEEDLLQKFEDVGTHGTKIIVYNLWFDDEGTMELDFESDPEDICLAGESRSYKKDASRVTENERHIANRLCYSLRAYLSVLYLRVPDSFCMMLRGRVVEYHNIATELKFPEFIVYKPQSAGCVEGQVLTTIGFLKEAPKVKIHGFNVYHKNRLILPFWHVVSENNNKGRGVVGVLEANFIQPTHNKQDFEKTAMFQKLEGRLKEMTTEYWQYHCHLIGYQTRPRVRPSPNFTYQNVARPSAELNRAPFPEGEADASPVAGPLHCQATDSSTSSLEEAAILSPLAPSSLQQGLLMKRKGYDQSIEPASVKRMTGMERNPGRTVSDVIVQPDILTDQMEDQETIIVMQENKKLHALCLEYEKIEVELGLKVHQLRTELGEAQREYNRMLVELQAVEKVKDEGYNVINR